MPTGDQTAETPKAVEKGVTGMEGFWAGLALALPLWAAIGAFLWMIVD